MPKRYVGIDVGAETVKFAEVIRDENKIHWERRAIVEHHKDPEAAIAATLREWNWPTVDGAAASGRLSRKLRLPRIPVQQAQSRAFRHLHSENEATVVSIGSHGFSVLELRATGNEILRENSRCSQGTGNFLRQLVERFNLSIEEASSLCENVETPAPLSGRCPVILKTDMTHLANKGEDRARILAGLYDAVCENVQVLLKPRISPPSVLLVGGVTRSKRVRDRFAGFLKRHDMTLIDHDAADDALYFEALGSAIIASERAATRPELDDLFDKTEHETLERLPSLRDSLPRVQRMKSGPAATINGAARQLVIGFDIGSTGSKAVALDGKTKELVWAGYINTNGNPVGAAQNLTQQFVDSPASRYPVIGVSATGSGREIVGSLLTTCYQPDAVYVINEIAAHAAGALHYDDRVDTIFEIGGQDAKYIRLAEGRVVDAAMNEACSAGTGSFIEEQGRKFGGIRDVVQLSKEALLADFGVSLGQHCSVFMAEIIDEAVASGVPQRSIIAGIYDSIIQNYLNRVKGSRSVGQVIFCQGMPFSADALAAAVARQTGAEVVIPPNPGNIGALGIALLAIKELNLSNSAPIDLQRFLNAELLRKETFVCKSTKGCGGAGNKCRIDRIKTMVEDKQQSFSWGGGCSLYDKGTRRKKLPDLAPDPFRERAELVQQIVDQVSKPHNRPVVAMTDEFVLKGLFPFFATFINELGFDLRITTGADQSALKRGIEQANVPFCAPMQLYHGVMTALKDSDPDFLFLPMVRNMPRTTNERTAALCPIVQGSADMVRWDLSAESPTKTISPVIDFGEEGISSRDFMNSCEAIAKSFGANRNWWSAFQVARAVQSRFEAELKEIGRRTLAFCDERNIVAVVVLGRAYTIHNQVLNSNVPAILREQGAIGIPVDCYPVDDSVPVFNDIFWGYGQQILRAAHQVRRTKGVYGVFCSNYSCGPDSFNLHFFSYIMEGKPFAIIETDGHSGDAGTKTRIEAFLYCVSEDIASTADGKRPRMLKLVEREKAQMNDIQQRDECVLIPRMGSGAESLAACLRAVGVRAESLPIPDRETVRIGRRYTSGKECVPMCITLGSLLQRIERDRNSDECFAFFMPTTQGPCRLGVYNLLHKITLERLDWKDRVRVWSPADNNYFENVPAGFSALVFAGFMANDLLLEALYDVRPAEKTPGAAKAIYKRYHTELLELLERKRDLSLPAVVYQISSRKLFGCVDLLRRAAREFAAVKGVTDKPTVLLVGEIYVRCDPFANDNVIERLEAKGVRCRFAPFFEWLEYVDVLPFTEQTRIAIADRLRSMMQSRILEVAYQTMSKPLNWAKRTTVKDSLAAAEPYIRSKLHGEAALTLGGPLHEWQQGHIDGVVSVGPLECMPSKIAEAQFFHVAEQEGLPSITLALNGDPVDPETLESFVFEVQAGHRQRQQAASGRRPQTKRPAQNLRS